MVPYRLRDWRNRQPRSTGHPPSQPLSRVVSLFQKPFPISPACLPDRFFLRVWTIPLYSPPIFHLHVYLTDLMFYVLQMPGCCRSSRLRTFRSLHCTRTDFPSRLSCCSEYARSDSRHTLRSLQSKSHLQKFPYSKSFLYRTRNPVLTTSSGFNITPAALFWKSRRTKVFSFALLTDITYLC